MNSRMKVFVPFSDLLLNEELMESLGLTIDDLVPFDLEYEVARPEAETPQHIRALEAAAAPA